jgi:hypothetical protein
MIVRLIRPEGGGSRWLLYAPGGVSGFIDATPELQSAMEGSDGYFSAERLEGRRGLVNR